MYPPDKAIVPFAVPVDDAFQSLPILKTPPEILTVLPASVIKSASDITSVPVPVIVTVPPFWSNIPPLFTIMGLYMSIGGVMVTVPPLIVSVPDISILSEVVKAASLAIVVVAPEWIISLSHVAAPPLIVSVPYISISSETVKLVEAPIVTVAPGRMNSFLHAAV